MHFTSAMPLLLRTLGLALGIPFAGAVGPASCAAQDARALADSARRPADSTAPRTARVVDETEQRMLDASARSAWSYVRRNYSATTGLVRALDSWEYVTVWDIASALASYYSARGLGLIDESEYRRRMDRALATLATMPLYQNNVFGRQYASRTGRMVDRAQKAAAVGYGWSAIDMGRLLVWMKIVEQSDPTAAPGIRAIRGRLDLSRLVKDGLLQGANTDLKFDNHYEYQEGRIGYEQYAAEALALWGVRAERALDFRANGRPVSVFGVDVLADARGDDLLTSEPFVMAGMELGWTNQTWSEQARGMLDAQRQRYEQTKRMTMLSEDAVPLRPAFFYYYLLHRNGKDFVVAAPGGATSASYPRWVSAKAAFGWHALFPSDYTLAAVKAVQPAGSSGRGWTAGVYEQSRRPTPSQNLNTAAVVLEAVYFIKRGCAFLQNC